jgi:regulator of sigma E protease
MEVFKSACYFIAVLSVLIIVHEWGHFIVAKLCKMRVDDFSLFFGKRLLRLGKRNGTEYNIRSIPLGGFVKIAGMEPEELGSPIFTRQPPVKVSIRRPILLAGLSASDLEKIEVESLSDRVLESVQDAVGENAKLTEGGRQDLEGLLLTTGLNEQEHQYIQTVLNADAYQPDPDGYNQKPLWQRAAVIFAGPFMSLFFGYALFCIMGFTTGLPDHRDNVVDVVNKGTAAERAGLQQGDRIVEINGQPINDWESLIKPIKANPGHEIHLVVLRNHKRVALNATPMPTPDQEDKKKIVGVLGFMPVISWGRYPAMQSVEHGSQMIYADVIGTLKSLFSRHVRDNVGGIITIAGVIHQESKEGMRNVMFTGAMLSISVGMLNLFPIPILDGGHLLLLSIEGIRRRRLSTREVYAAQMVGLSIICVLFVLVMYNDILRVFLHKS